ncbi:3,2-trans-enoyl-CoA isomerase, mitochondrial [Angomonas deanei]|nr:3,2-trans-enoyl-CoA isomerase, mitochondrial [Angomonas deanei]|eukprot:EPY26568.1 3,2-trans-enoyl-CoA isomerase, mitochondrial [Angomonas deanei]
MNSKPVNVLNREYHRRLTEWFRYLNNDDATRAIILTSAIPNIFTAGLDINEMVNPSLEKFTEMWTTVQENWYLLQAHYKPIIVVINGTSPGEGAVMSLCCDYRVMVRGAPPKEEGGAVRPFKFGLNEASFGLRVPRFTAEVYRQILGSHRADRMLQLGEMVTADNALTLGLVDEVVDSREEGMRAAIAYAKRLVAIDPKARYFGKKTIRAPFLRGLETQEERDSDLQEFYELVLSDTVQTTISNYFASLKKK